MSSTRQVDTFRSIWDTEAERAIRLLESLPEDQYDYRPDPGGRSIGELAWHLSEIDACISFGFEVDRFSYEDEVPNMKRPREVALLAPGYRRIHDEAVPRLARLTDGDLDRVVAFSDGRHLSIRDILWNELLHHHIHHRAQLVMLCRMAGGQPPGLYGPNREEMKAMIAKMMGK